jgi:hypothetical protein
MSRFLRGVSGNWIFGNRQPQRGDKQTGLGREFSGFKFAFRQGQLIGDADESWISNFCEEHYLAILKRLSFMTIASG